MAEYKMSIGETKDVIDDRGYLKGFECNRYVIFEIHQDPTEEAYAQLDHSIISVKEIVGDISAKELADAINQYNNMYLYNDLKPCKVNGRDYVEVPLKELTSMEKDTRKLLITKVNDRGGELTAEVENYHGVIPF